MISDKTIQLALDLAIKYKNQLSFLAVILLMLVSFNAGKSSVNCPGEEVLCLDIKKTKDKLFDDLEKEKNICKEKIRIKIDEEQEICDKRVRTSVDAIRKNYSKITCKICKAMKGQCK